MDAQIRSISSASVKDDNIKPIREFEEHTRSSPRKVTRRPLRIPSVSISVHDDSEIPVEQRSIISPMSEHGGEEVSEDFQLTKPEQSQKVRGASMMGKVQVKMHGSEQVTVRPTSLPVSRTLGSMVHVFTSPVPVTPVGPPKEITESQDAKSVSETPEKTEVKINLSRGHKFFITLPDETEDPVACPHRVVSDGSIKSDSSSEGLDSRRSSDPDFSDADEVDTFITYERLPEDQVPTPPIKYVACGARMYLKDDIEVLGQDIHTNQGGSPPNPQSRASLFARCFTCTLYDEDEFDEGSLLRISNSLPITFSVAEKLTEEQIKRDRFLQKMKKRNAMCKAIFCLMVLYFVLLFAFPILNPFRT